MRLLTPRALLPLFSPRQTFTRVYLSSSSSFQPPTPPTSQIPATHPDIDFEILQQQQHQQKLQSHKRNTDPNAVYLVTGANRGIGLQHVKSLSSRVSGTILACCRTPDIATELHNFLYSHDTDKKIRILPLDVTQQDQIESVGRIVEERYGRLDALFNVAGVLGDGGTTTPGPERSLARIDPEWFRHSLEVNLVGPTMLAQRLVPLMTTKNDSERRATSVIVNVSARVGSISDNGMGGWYSYRSSKAALNQMTRTMGHELKRKGVWVVGIHPGTTDTDLSKPFQRNVKEGRLFPVDFTVGRMLDVVDCMEERNTGGFYDWAGKALPF